MAVKYEPHWHEPDRERLMISVQRLRDMLGVSDHRAYLIAHALDLRYYTEGGRHARVTMESVRHYLALHEEHGYDALEILRQQKQLGWSPTLEHDIAPRSWTYLWRREQRRSQQPER